MRHYSVATFNLPPILLAILTLPNPTTAKEVLVSTQKQLENAVAAAAPGDTVVIHDGTWPDCTIKLQASGTPEHPVTVKAQTPGAVKLTGKTRVDISGAHLVVTGLLFQDAHSTKHSSIVEFRRANRCRLTECSFVKCGDPNSTYTRTVNLTYGSTHCRVDHCYMTGTLSMGMGVVVRHDDSGRGNTDNRFDHNYFKDIQRISSNGQEPIQLGQDQTAYGTVSVRAVVEYNLFENTSGDSEIISNKSADNIIRFNTMRDSKAGICLRGGQNVLVEGNDCHRTYGIRVFGRGHTIANNYLKETDGGILLDAGQYRAGQFVNRESSGSYQAPSNVLVAHNTIVNPRGSGIRVGHGHGQKHGGVERNELPQGITIVNNLITGHSAALIANEGSHDLKWQSNFTWPLRDAKLGIQHPGIIQANPLLLLQDGRYLPSPPSPARDAGTALPEVTTDYSGHKRDAHPDIGSDEVSQAKPTRSPLRPTDVGPSWNQTAPGHP